MNQDERFLIELKQVVFDNLTNEQFSVYHLSKTVGLSRSHLHRKLKKLTGLSISKFIRQIRLEEAKKLLLNDEATTAEIAYQVGFNSTSYFHKCFHNHYGYPPSEAKHASQSQVLNSDSVKGDKKKSDSVLYKTISISILAFAFIGYFTFYFFNQAKSDDSNEKSIAVLPFKNLSKDEGNQFFADGLVEDLSIRLATIHKFKVISRTSSDTYRHEDTKKIDVIASELGASYILEGSVQKYDNKVRISVQLIDAKRDDHIWIKSFDRDLSDIFKIQSEITMQIASGLETALTEQQVFDIRKNQTENVKAFERYQLGRFHWNKRTFEGYKTSIKYYENAIVIDSLYGLAYAGLADTYNLMALQGWIDQTVGRNKAVKFAKKALRLDPDLAQAHTVLASIYTYIDWNWELAEQEYVEAIKLNPNYSTVYHYYSEHLSIVGRHAEARKMIDKAIELNPLSFVIRRVSAKLYIGQGELNKALEENMLCGELQKNHPWTYSDRFEILYYQKDYAKAYEAFKDYIRASHIELPVRFESSYSKMKLEELIKWIIKKRKSEFDKAYYYALLGDNEASIDILEKLFDAREISPEFTFRYVFRNMHNDVRFRSLLEKMNLPAI